MYPSRLRHILVILPLIVTSMAFAKSQSDEIQFDGTFNEMPEGVQKLITLDFDEAGNAIGGIDILAVERTEDEKAPVRPLPVRKFNPATHDLVILQYQSQIKTITIEGKKYAIEVNIPTGVKKVDFDELNYRDQVLAPDTGEMIIIGE